MNLIRFGRTVHRTISDRFRPLTESWIRENLWKHISSLKLKGFCRHHAHFQKTIYSNLVLCPKVVKIRVWPKFSKSMVCLLEGHHNSWMMCHPRQHSKPYVFPFPLPNETTQTQKKWSVPLKKWSIHWEVQDLVHDHSSFVDALLLERGGRWRGGGGCEKDDC